MLSTAARRTTGMPASSPSPRAASSPAPYLPWLSGTIAAIPLPAAGFEDGHGLGYTIGAMALASAPSCRSGCGSSAGWRSCCRFVLAGFVVPRRRAQLRRHADMNTSRRRRRQRGLWPLGHDRRGLDRVDRRGAPQRGRENQLTCATLVCLPGVSQSDPPDPTDEDVTMSGITTQRYGTAAVAVARAMTSRLPRTTSWAPRWANGSWSIPCTVPVTVPQAPAPTVPGDLLVTSKGDTQAAGAHPGGLFRVPLRHHHDTNHSTRTRNNETGEVGNVRLRAHRNHPR